MLSINESFLILDANYDIAVKLWEERFSNIRELANASIHKLFNLCRVTNAVKLILHCEWVCTFIEYAQPWSISSVKGFYCFPNNWKNIKFWYACILKKKERSCSCFYKTMQQPCSLNEIARLMKGRELHKHPHCPQVLMCSCYRVLYNMYSCVTIYLQVLKTSVYCCVQAIVKVSDFAGNGILLKLC